MSLCIGVIGSGSSGRWAALLGARRGLRTAVIEGANIGGSCFHRGSYAVRALLACARQFRDRWKSGRFGNRVDLLKVTLNDWMTAQRMVSAPRGLSYIAQSLVREKVHIEFQAAKIEFAIGIGKARFAGQNSL